jgi:L,D-transpeptidase ErfK/SrfK
MMSPYRTSWKLQAFGLMLAVLCINPAHNSAEAKTFDSNIVGKLESARVQGKETLMDVAEKYQVGYAQLLAANPGVDPWLPGANRKLILPNWHILPDTVHQGIVLNTGELRMYYFPPDGSAPKSFPIGIGREGLTTPIGTTTIVSKVKGPSWRPTPRMRQEDPELPAVVEEGPDNPLGAYAMYLGWPSYRIHGTNKPKAIGRRASSGCIRMYSDEIDWLFHTAPIGTKVTSVNQPVKMAWIGDDFYIEAEPNDVQVDEIEYQNRQITVQIPDGIVDKIREKAGDKGDRIDWEKVRTALVQRMGIPTRVTKATGQDAAWNDIPDVTNSVSEERKTDAEIADEIAAQKGNKDTDETIAPQIQSKAAHAVKGAPTPLSSAAKPNSQKSSVERAKSPGGNWDNLNGN